MNEDIILRELEAIQKQLRSITSYFTKGEIRLTKDCLQTQTNGDRPVRQREFKRLEKLLWWVIGIVSSSGIFVAGAKFLL